MNVKLSKIILILSLVYQGCAAPSEPSGLSSSGVDKSSGGEAKATPVKTSGGGGTDFGGALVGDAIMQASVKKCVDQGKFFDRKSQKCTEMGLAQVSCKDDSIKKIMKSDIKSQYEGLLSGSLAGYKLDQCLDCSVPSGNALCEGTASSKVADPGVRLYLVKESKGMLEIKTVYIRN